MWMWDCQDLWPALMAFKSARFFSLKRIITIRPSPSDINDMSVLPFPSSPVIKELKKDFPDYLTQAEDVSILFQYRPQKLLKKIYREHSCALMKYSAYIIQKRTYMYMHMYIVVGNNMYKIPLTLKPMVS